MNRGQTTPQTKTTSPTTAESDEPGQGQVLRDQDRDRILEQVDAQAKPGIEPGDDSPPREVPGQRDPAQRDQVGSPAQERVGVQPLELEVGPPEDGRAQAGDRHDRRDAAQQVGAAVEGQPVVGQLRPHDGEPVEPRDDAGDSRRATAARLRNRYRRLSADEPAIGLPRARCSLPAAEGPSRLRTEHLAETDRQAGQGTRPA